MSLDTKSEKAYFVSPTFRARMTTSVKLMSHSRSDLVDLSVAICVPAECLRLDRFMLAFRIGGEVELGGGAGCSESTKRELRGTMSPCSFGNCESNVTSHRAKVKTTHSVVDSIYSRQNVPGLQGRSSQASFR